MQRIVDFKKPKSKDEDASSDFELYPPHLRERTKTRKHSLLKDVCAIDVLVAEANANSERQTRQRYQSFPNSKDLSSTTEDALLRQVPDRIRISSITLLKTLEKITGEAQLSGVGHSGDKPLAFIRPYKLFCYYAEDTKAYYQSLTGYHEREESIEKNIVTENTNDPPHLQYEQIASDLSDITRSKEALEHLGLLVEVFDYDLASFDLRRQVKNGKLESIAFIDLWHLFKRDEEVCLPDGALQIYRVQHCFGGRQILSTDNRRPDVSSDEDSEGLPSLRRFEKKTPFTVQCFLFDFNGKYYGPRHKTFKIHPYRGERSLTSLAVSPIRFHQHVSQYRSTLKIRGNKFVELTKVVHRQYTGQSLDDHREEVKHFIHQ